MERILRTRPVVRPVRRSFPRSEGTDPDARRLERWALAAILAVAGGQLLFLLTGGGWELCGDEAEYWACSRRLDWSYYAGRPLLALVIRLGTVLFSALSETLSGSLMPAVRLPAVVLGGLTGWGVFRLGQQVCGSARAGLIALLLLPAVPLFRIGGLLMTVDSPLICCWTWAAVWTCRALGGEAAARRGWLIAGVLAAAGVLAKYTMLAFPASVGFYLLLSRTHRKELLRPGFWAMAALCGLGMMPILAWNVGHDWVAAGQMAERIGLNSRGNWGSVLPLLAFLGGEVAVLGGIWWLVGVCALRRAGLVALGREGSDESERPMAEGLLYLLCLWAVVWSACFVVSLLGENEANWAAPGYVSVLVLSGWWLDRGLLRNGIRRPAGRLGWACVLLWGWSLFNLTALQYTDRFYPIVAGLVPKPTLRCPAPLRRLDPTNRMRGHRALMPEVERRLAELRARGEDPFVLAPTYTLAAEISFYLPGQPDVYCLAFSRTPGRAANQHDLWHPNPRFDPDAFRGRPAVIVEDANFFPSYARALQKLGCFERTGETTRFLVREHGLPIAAWDVSNGRDYRGRPGDIASKASPNPL